MVSIRARPTERAIRRENFSPYSPHMFQSAPAQLSGRYRTLQPRIRALNPFQSAPAQLSGRYGEPIVATAVHSGSFNPRPPN